jgi:hypothetical protein
LDDASLFRRLFETATEFCDLRLWEIYANAHCFAVEVEEEEHPLFASILGNAGEEFGLSLMRGRDGYDRLLDLFDPDFNDAIGEQMNAIGCTLTPMSMIPPDFRRPFRLAGRPWNAKGAVVPFFLVKEAGKRARGLRAEEARLVLHVLNGVLTAHHNDLLTPKLLMPGDEMLTLVLSGDVSDPEVTAQWVVYEESPEPAAGAPRSRAVDGIESLPILPQRWLVGFPVLPVAIDGDDRTVRAVLVMDAASELIIGTDIVSGNDTEAACDYVCQMLAKTEGLPREMVFSSRELFDATAAGFEELGVTCTLEAKVPVLDRAVSELTEHIGPRRRKSQHRGTPRKSRGT